jgi:hypothetical protein
MFSLHEQQALFSSNCKIWCSGKPTLNIIFSKVEKNKVENSIVVENDSDIIKHILKLKLILHYYYNYYLFLLNFLNANLKL